MSRGNPPASEAGRTGPAMAVSTTASDPPPRATKITVAVLGLLVAFAGIEHGVGEIMQGSVPPESRVIESWRDVYAFEQLGGEPALTIIPNLLITGIMAIGVSVAIAVWSVWFADRRHGGLVLIGLSIVLLLVGGGFGPPLIGVLVGITAIGMGRPPTRKVTPASRLLSRLYPWPLVVTVLAFLALAPGTVVLRHFVGVDEALVVIVLIVTAFASLLLALITARARDRRPESTGPPAEAPGRGTSLGRP
jgi:hypothetical protein